MKGDGDLPNKGITNIKYLAAAATGATAPKFSDTLTLFQPGGQILPTIGTVAPRFSPWLRP